MTHDEQQDLEVETQAESTETTEQQSVVSQDPRESLAINEPINPDSLQGAIEAILMVAEVPLSTGVIKLSAVYKNQL